MKRILFYTLLNLFALFIVCSCTNSEYSLDNLVPFQYHKIVYFKNGGEQNLSLYTTQTNYKDSLIIIKAGSDPSLTAGVKVNVMTQAEVDSIYSNVEGVDYKVIPQDAYSFDNGQEIAFGKNETGKYLSLTLNPVKIYDQITADPDAKYIVPLQLVSEKDSVNSDLDKCLLIIDVKKPTVTFYNTEQDETMIYKSLNANIPVNLANCDINRSDFTYSMDNTQDAQLVANYNSLHGTSYELLPNRSYTISGLGFKDGSLIDTATVSINRADLQNDHTYLLPLKISGTSLGEQIEVSPATSYLVVSNPKYGIVYPDRSQWKVLFCNNDNKMAGSGSDNAGPYALLDGNVNTYWHSNWQGPSASGYQQTGHYSGDDYDYLFTDYNAFFGRRSVGQTVIVLDLQTVKHLVGVGVTPRQNQWDLKSLDVCVSNDAAFNFKPMDKGGTLSDYDAVALNNWAKLCSVNVPQQNTTYWQKTDLSTIQNGGIKGRFVKIHFTASYRDPYINMSEFQVMELLSINGNPVQ